MGRPQRPHPRRGHQAVPPPGRRELTLAYEELAITAEPGLVLMVYTAEPGSPSAERLRLLASWAATTEAAASVPADPVGRHTRDTEGT